MNTDMQSDSNRITEEELDAMEHKAQVMGDICTCCEDTRRLIAEVRRLRAVLNQAAIDMWVDGDMIYIKIGEDGDTLEYERVDVFQELAAHLTYDADAPADGECGGGE